MRFKGLGLWVPEPFYNAGTGSKELREFCQISQEGEELLRQAVHWFSLNARALPGS